MSLVAEYRDARAHDDARHTPVSEPPNEHDVSLGLLGGRGLGALARRGTADGERVKLEARWAAELSLHVGAEVRRRPHDKPRAFALHVGGEVHHGEALTHPHDDVGGGVRRQRVGRGHVGEARERAARGKNGEQHEREDHEGAGPRGSTREFVRDVGRCGRHGEGRRVRIREVISNE